MFILKSRIQLAQGRRREDADRYGYSCGTQGTIEAQLRSCFLVALQWKGSVALQLYMEGFLNCSRRVDVI